MTEDKTMIERRNNKRLSGLALAAALALPAGAVQGADTIRIGGLAPLSSPGSYQQGPELVLGLQWAVDDVNAAGGVARQAGRADRGGYPGPSPPPAPRWSRS